MKALLRSSIFALFVFAGYAAVATDISKPHSNVAWPQPQYVAEEDQGFGHSGLSERRLVSVGPTDPKDPRGFEQFHGRAPRRGRIERASERDSHRHSCSVVAGAGARRRAGELQQQP